MSPRIIIEFLDELGRIFVLIRYRIRSLFVFSRHGFTALEAVLVLAIITLLSTVVLVSFPSFSDTIALQRSSRALALSLRKAQNMALAVRSVSTQTGPRIPDSFGIYIDKSSRPNSYIVFADFFPSGNPNGRYDGQPGSTDVIVETVALDSGVAFGEITCPVGASDRCDNVVNIAFGVPEGAMRISDQNSQLGESAEIFLRGGRGSGLSRSVVVRTTGQVQVK